VLVEAAARVLRDVPDVGFAVFGDGPRRPVLGRRIAELDLGGRFILAGPREDGGRFMHHRAVPAPSSFTEGLPDVLLEAYADRSSHPEEPVAPSGPADD
jgi:glycosyltransferase involved in cell wall biosynthesis